MKALIKSFMNIKFVKKYKLHIISLIKSCKLKLISDKLIFNITHIARFILTFKKHVKKL